MEILFAVAVILAALYIRANAKRKRLEALSLYGEEVGDTAVFVDFDRMEADLVQNDPAPGADGRTVLHVRRSGDGHWEVRMSAESLADKVTFRREWIAQVARTDADAAKEMIAELEKVERNDWTRWEMINTGRLDRQFLLYLAAQK